MGEMFVNMEFQDKFPESSLYNKVRRHIILAKFLKSQGVDEEKLGRLFNKFIDEVSYEELNLYTSNQPISFCDILVSDPKEGKTEGVVIGCPVETSEEEVYKNIVNFLLGIKKW